MDEQRSLKASVWSVRTRTKAFVWNHKAEWRSGNNGSKCVFPGAEKSSLPLISTVLQTGWWTVGSTFISRKLPEEAYWIDYTTSDCLESILAKLEAKFKVSQIDIFNFLIQWKMTRRGSDEAHCKMVPCLEASHAARMPFHQCPTMIGTLNQHAQSVYSTKC